VMRVAATAIGLLILSKWALESVIYYMAVIVRKDFSAQLLSRLVGLIVGTLCFTLFEWLYGATPGKLLLGLRVVKVTGQRCGLARALVRSILRPVDVLYSGIAAIVNGFSFGLPVLRFMEAPLCQRIGDKVAGTIVARSRQPWLQPRRPWGWMLVALGLSFVLALSLQIGFLRFVYSAAAPWDAHAMQAAVAHTRKDYARAAELLERAIDEGMPQDRLLNTHFLLGNEYYLLGNVDKAIQAQKRALEIDPTFYPSWMSLATAYWAAGEPDRAEECLRRYVELAPDRPEGYVSLSWLYLERGQVEQAVKSLERALALDPHSAEAHAYLALAYAQQGRFEDAQDSLHTAKENGYADWQLLQEQIESLEAEWQEP
jgi:uncharacterized RDD family membrane protein YckC/thioredoxin-like negative regulator of GroEL